MAQSKKNRVMLINPYYGKWPVWLPAFLLSCKSNPQFTWLIPTDCEIPANHPENVIFVKSSLSELSRRASAVTGLNIDMQRPYKLNDIRPLFGKIFADELSNYDFWGHCDIDVIWGDIGNFITEEILNQHDVISAREENIAGHFTIYRNSDKVNNLYSKHEIFKDAFLRPESYYFDEVGMTEVIKSEIKTGGEIKVYWPKYLLNFYKPRKIKPSNVPKVLNHWRWENGKLYEEGEDGGEIMYLHFMTWKKTFKHCFIDYNESINSFYISYTHISKKKSPLPANLGIIPVSKFMPSLFN